MRLAVSSKTQARIAHIPIPWANNKANLDDLIRRVVKSNAQGAFLGLQLLILILIFHLDQY